MKILYMMHIQWEWIFQRPQILELYLEKDFESYTVCPKVLLKKRVTSSNVMPKNKITAWRLPREERYKIIRKINEWLCRRAIGNVSKKYDVIWIGYPMLFQYIPKDYKGKIVYDCMDDYVAMASDSDKAKMEELETALLNRADLIFASSQRLIDKKVKDKNAVLVRNGYLNKESYPMSEVSIKNKYVIGYFGTVSSWFDFDLLKNNLKTCDNVEYRIIGPVESSVRETVGVLDNRISFEGTIEHSMLYEHIKDYDALMMPFVINDTILAVDPVKLYEYINFGKCVISVWYPEIERFEPFVYFYRNQKEYDELIESLSMSGFKPKYSEEMKKEFLEQNTWDCRYNTIKQQLDSVLK